MRFFEYAKNGDIQNLERMMDKDETLLLQKDDKEWTVLEHAISECQLECCFWLIECGCILNPKKRRSRSLPLQVALRTNVNTLAPLKLLFSLGANLNLCDVNGQTPLWVTFFFFVKCMK